MGTGTSLQHYNSPSQNIVFETIDKEPREALEDPKTSTANEAGPQMAFPRIPASMSVPECGGASPLSVGHEGQLVLTGEPSDPSLIPRPLSCAEGDSARLAWRTPLRRKLAAADTENRIYNDI